MREGWRDQPGSKPQTHQPRIHSQPLQEASMYLQPKRTNYPTNIARSIPWSAFSCAARQASDKRPHLILHGPIVHLKAASSQVGPNEHCPQERTKRSLPFMCIKNCHAWALKPSCRKGADRLITPTKMNEIQAEDTNGIDAATPCEKVVFK